MVKEGEAVEAEKESWLIGNLAAQRLELLQVYTFEEHVNKVKDVIEQILKPRRKR